MYTLNLSDRRKLHRVVELEDIITISKLHFFEAITSHRKQMHTHEMFQCYNNLEKSRQGNSGQYIITDLKMTIVCTITYYCNKILQDLTMILFIECP